MRQGLLSVVTRFYRRARACAPAIRRELGWWIRQIVLGVLVGLLVALILTSRMPAL